MTVHTSVKALGMALLLVLGLCSTLASAQDDGSKQFPVSGFTAIALKGSSQLRIVQGEVFSVSAYGPVEGLAFAKAELRGETLELSVEPDKKSLFGVVTISSEPDIEFKVTLPKVSGIRVSGSGEAIADTIESEKLNLQVTGSGVIRINKVAAEQLNTGLTGSGDLIIGTALAVRGSASITGSGDLRMDSFTGEALSAQIKGSGDMVIGGRVADLKITIMGSGDFVGSNLKADDAGGSVMGSGDIVLRRPAKESFSVMGSGEIALVD